MVHYKLTYFPGRGRGEIIRLLFTYGDVPFEDIRISFEEWGALKPKTPFQSGLPLLEIDGAVYTQSLAITRYAAAVVGLEGGNPLECLRAGNIVAQLSDLRFTISPIILFEKDENVKKEKLAHQEKVEMPKTLDRLEQMVNEHGYLVSTKVYDATTLDGQYALNYADIYLMDTLDVLQIFDLSKWPKLVALQKRVAHEPKLAAWIKTRPQSPI